jgi:hypothetical protein
MGSNEDADKGTEWHAENSAHPTFTIAVAAWRRSHD